MDYKRFDDTILVRMDRGEEILEQVKAVALKEQVTLASVQALGAINDFTVGVYNVAEKKYYANDFKGSFEIVSLTGTIDLSYTCTGRICRFCGRRFVYHCCRSGRPACVPFRRKGVWCTA